MELNIIILICIAAMFSIFCIVRRWRAGHKLLGFKEVVNRLFSIGSVIWMMFAILFLIMMGIPMIGWINKFILSTNWSVDFWPVRMLPLFYLITGMVVLVLAACKLLSYRLWKYTYEEKKILDIESKKWKERFQRWLRLSKKTAR